MAAYTYDYPEAVRNIIRDARAVNPPQHGNAQEGHMELLCGTAGRFVVHIRQERNVPAPGVRVLTLPEGVADMDALQYARSHQEEFTPWHPMVY